MCPLNTHIGLAPLASALRTAEHRDNFNTFIDAPLQGMAIRIQ
jgi:hypothetical protein